MPMQATTTTPLFAAALNPDRSPRVIGGWVALSFAAVMATPLAVEQQLLKAVPPQYLLHAHHWLILHGRYVCKARKPECWRCVIAEWCRFEPKTPLPKGK